MIDIGVNLSKYSLKTKFNRRMEYKILTKNVKHLENLTLEESIKFNL